MIKSAVNRGKAAAEQSSTSNGPTPDACRPNAFAYWSAELTIGDMIIAPARFSTMFLAGLFKIGDSHLYVNRGLGTTVPPIMINAPPEITHITLTAV
jgi:hypothetical protein